MAVTIERSYALCRQLTRRSGSSFAVGMRLFPRPARPAIEALYAFFRTTDDLVDEAPDAATGHERLDAWGRAVELALAGGPVAADGILPAVVDAARRHKLPATIFTACLAACATDLGPVRLASWTELDRYCDGVAGTVGEACLRILGDAQPAQLELAAVNARAVQLTNILRDIREDQRRDRVYLPAELLAAHGVTPEALAAERWSPPVLAALTAAADRAERLYEQAEPLFYLLAPEHRPPVVAMTLKYRRLLALLRTERFVPPAKSRTRAHLPAILLAARAARWRPTWRG